MSAANEPDFTYSVHTGKSSRSSKKGISSSNEMVSKTESNTSFLMQLVPIVISIGTVALVYLLYKEIKKNQKTNYELSQTVKNCQAKIVDLEKQGDQSADLTEILKAASSNIIFEGAPGDSNEEDSGESGDNTDGDDNNIVITTID